MASKTMPYDDYDWEELPEEVQKAATILGYDEDKWDNDEETEFDDYDWDELTDEQKAAAAVFGYDKEKWDTDD